MHTLYARSKKHSVKQKSYKLMINQVTFSLNMLNVMKSGVKI